MARIFTSYEDAAASLYAAGRSDYRSGFARTDPNRGPMNAAIFDQGYLTNPTILNDPLFPLYGQPWTHYYFGWDDERYSWPDRGWRKELSRIGVPLRPAGSPPDATLESWAAWLYTYAWQEAKKDPNFRTDVTGTLTRPALGIGEAAAKWQMDMAKRDALGAPGAQTPPDQGFYPFPAAVLIGYVNPNPNPPQLAAPQGGMVGGGDNILGTFMILSLLRKRQGQGSNKNKKKGKGLFGSLF